MLGQLPTEVVCEIVSHSTNFTCDYYPTEKKLVYPESSLETWYGFDPSSGAVTLLFKTLYVNVKADNLPVGTGGHMGRLPDVRQVVFYTEKKPRDVVREDFPIHMLQKWMDPHWDLKLVNDILDLPTQYVKYQYPAWRASKIRVVSVAEATQLTRLFNFFDRSVRYPIKLVHIAAPQTRGLWEIVGTLARGVIASYIDQYQAPGRGPLPMRETYEYTYDMTIDLPGVEGERIGAHKHVKRHLLSPSDRKRASACCKDRPAIKQRYYLHHTKVPAWRHLSWEYARNRPDINILLKTFFSELETYDNRLLGQQKSGEVANYINRYWSTLVAQCHMSTQFRLLWTRYLRTKGTAIHIIQDDIGQVLMSAWGYDLESDRYMHARAILQEWSQKEQWESKEIIALMAYIPGHAVTLAYFRSTNLWVHYDTGRFMTMKYISDVVYLLNQYVDPSEPDPVICWSIETPGQKKEIFWQPYGECSLHAAGRLELLSQGIFDPMVAVDTDAVRHKLISIVGVYGGFVAIAIESYLADTARSKPHADRLWQRHEADVRELYRVNPATRQNIKRLYPMHSFDIESNERDDLVVSPVSGVVEESVHADFEDGSWEELLQVYIRGPNDEVQDDHRIFAPISGVLTYTTRRMREGDTFFEADPDKLGVMIAKIGPIEFKVFVGRGYVTDEIRMDVRSGDKVRKGQVIGEIIVRPGNSRAEIAVQYLKLEKSLSENPIGMVLEGGKTVIGKK